MKLLYYVHGDLLILYKRWILSTVMGSLGFQHLQLPLVGFIAVDP